MEKENRVSGDGLEYLVFDESGMTMAKKNKIQKHPEKNTGFEINRFACVD